MIRGSDGATQCSSNLENNQIATVCAACKTAPNRGETCACSTAATYSLPSDPVLLFQMKKAVSTSFAQAPTNDSTAESAPPSLTHRRTQSTKKARHPVSLNLSVDLSIRAEGPYLTYSMIRRMAENEAKKKWLSPQGFIAVSKPKPSFIPNYVGATPSQAPVLHSYRDVEKQKWLHGNFKPGKYSYKRLIS